MAFSWAARMREAIFPRVLVLYPLSCAHSRTSEELGDWDFPCRFDRAGGLPLNALLRPAAIYCVRASLNPAALSEERSIS